MLHSRVASRYASALLGAARQANVLDDVRKDVDLLKVSVAVSRELASFLKSPIISADRKAAALKSIFEDKVSILAMNFLLLLVEKTREAELPQILTSFDAQYNEYKGIVEAHISSAIELDEQQKQAILDKVRRYTGKTVVPDYRLDPTLIGGFQVRIGDSILDGSVKHQIENLKKTLMAGEFNN